MPSPSRFEEHPSIRMLAGPGRVETLPELLPTMPGAALLLVTDPGLVACGHAGRVTAILEAAGHAVHTFDAVAPNPTTADGDAGIALVRARGPVAAIVALGGGSAMDCAKGINFLLSNGGRMEDYWGFGKADRPMLPSIGIPTTAGTGSEAQSFALISRLPDHRKMACGDRKARFHTVVLDPELTTTVPRDVAAASGLDALAHALESYVCTRANTLSRMYAREAWRLLTGHVEAVLDGRANGDARGAMQVGAYLAGTAIETSMLGAAHAAANPLTARHDITHGIAVAVMLPAVLRWNAAVVGTDYAELAAYLPGRSTADPADRIGRWIRERLAQAGLPTTLGGLAIPPGAVDALAGEAAEQWTGTFNPRPLTAADFARLYRETL